MRSRQGSPLIKMKLSIRVLLFAVFVYSCFAAETQESKAKKNGSTTPKDKMEVVDWIRSGAMVVGFLAVMYAGRKTWILADMITSAAFGAAAFFFPASLLGYQTVGDLDPVHLYYTQVLGALMLSQAAMWYYSRNTRDNAVQVSLISSHAFAGAILVMSVVFDHLRSASDKQRWSEQHLSCGLLGAVLLLIGSIIQLVRSGQYGVGTVNLSDRLSRHLLFDVFLMVCYGVFLYANPHFELDFLTLKNFKADGIHGSLVRRGGILMFATGLHGLNAFSFPSNTDKRAYFLSSLVLNLLIYPTVVLYQWKYQLYAQSTAVAGLLFGLLPAGNAAAAFFYQGKQKAY